MKFSFEMALAYLKQGKKICCAEWESDMYMWIEGGRLYVSWPEDDAPCVLEVEHIEVDDLLAEDWMIYEGNNNES